jgi:hypothetical protein
MKSERGEVSLISLLTAAVLTVIVLGATLTMFNQFEVQSRDQQNRTITEDRVRNASDTMARELRNLATPTPLQPQAVNRAEPYDIIFETIAATGTPPAGNPTNVEFLRYCIDGGGRLWRMEYPPAALAVTPSPPSTTGCAAGTGWLNAHVVATQITNRSAATPRPVFTFDSTVPSNIDRVRADFYVDADLRDGAKEQRISTGVQLRNQDRAPAVTDFSYASPEPGVGVLNASLAADPDNDPLSYCWFDRGVPATAKVGSCTGNATIGGAIADVPIYRYRTTSGTHRITLKVSDPSDLPAMFSKDVVVR